MIINGAQHCKCKHLSQIHAMQRRQAGWWKKAAAAFIADFFKKPSAQHSAPSLFIFRLDNVIMINSIFFLLITRDHKWCPTLQMKTSFSDPRYATQAGWRKKAAAAFIADFFIKALVQRNDSSLFIFHLDDAVMISVILFL